MANDFLVEFASLCLLVVFLHVMLCMFDMFLDEFAVHTFAPKLKSGRSLLDSLAAPTLSLLIGLGAILAVLHSDQLRPSAPAERAKVRALIEKMTSMPPAFIVDGKPHTPKSYVYQETHGTVHAPYFLAIAGAALAPFLPALAQSLLIFARWAHGVRISLPKRINPLPWLGIARRAASRRADGWRKLLHDTAIPDEETRAALERQVLGQACSSPKVPSKATSRL